MDIRATVVEVPSFVCCDACGVSVRMGLAKYQPLARCSNHANPRSLGIQYFSWQRRLC